MEEVCTATERAWPLLTAKLISIIGPPAVGKTTLAEGLSAELPAQLLREDYAGNPFLGDSYVGGPEARLPSQLYFLMSRAKQLARATWPATGRVVSDYGYCQDRVFARERLDEEARGVYRRVARRVDPLVQSPDVVIALDAGVETLLRRIAERGRGFEAAMTGEFLARMREAYAAAEGELSCPVLRVDCDAADLRDPAWRAGVAREIRQHLDGA